MPALTANIFATATEGINIHKGGMNH